MRSDDKTSQKVFKSPNHFSSHLWGIDEELKSNTIGDERADWKINWNSKLLSCVVVDSSWSGEEIANYALEFEFKWSVLRARSVLCVSPCRRTFFSFFDSSFPLHSINTSSSHYSGKASLQHTRQPFITINYLLKLTSLSSPYTHLLSLSLLFCPVLYRLIARLVDFQFSSTSLRCCSFISQSDEMSQHIPILFFC